MVGKRGQSKSKKEWTPDPRIAEILRPFYDMAIGAYTAWNQPVPQNVYEIKKWPARETIRKYWKAWTDELIALQEGTLAQTQKEVKAKYLSAYDTQIMIAESQIQDLLRARSELKAVWKKGANKLKESNKEDEIDPYLPNFDLEKLLMTLNGQMGNFKMSRAQLEVAPRVDQISEDAIIKDMEIELDKAEEKKKKIVTR